MIRHCRAYDAADLAVHPGFARVLAGRDEPPALAYLWDDGGVTELPFADAPVLFAADAAAWRDLDIEVPTPVPTS